MCEDVDGTARAQLFLRNVSSASSIWGFVAHKDLLSALRLVPSACMCLDSAETEPHQSQTPTFFPPELELKTFSPASSQQQQRRAGKDQIPQGGFVSWSWWEEQSKSQQLLEPFSHLGERSHKGVKSSWVLERMSKPLLLQELLWIEESRFPWQPKFIGPVGFLLLVLMVSPAALCLGSLLVPVFSFKFVFHSSVFSDTWGGNAAQSYLSCVCCIPVLQKEFFGFKDQTTVKLHPISPVFFLNI